MIFMALLMQQFMNFDDSRLKIFRSENYECDEFPGLIRNECNPLLKKSRFIVKLLTYYQHNKTSVK